MTDLSEFSGTRKLLAVAITAVALFAVCLSSYLTWITWQQSTVAGCTGASAASCDEVLASAESKWLGIPVSLFGALTYTGILVLVWPAVIFGGWAMTILMALAMLAAGAGVWFVGAQALVVHHFCLYCMTIHACGLLICGAAVFLMRSAANEPDFDHMRAFFGAENPVTYESSTADAFQPLIAAGIAVVGLMALIGGQVFFSPAGMEVVEDIPVQVAEEPAATTDQATSVEETVVTSDPTEPVDEPVVVTDQPDEPTEVTPEPSGDSTTDVLDEPANEQADDVAFGLFDEPESDPSAKDAPESEEDEPDPALEFAAAPSDSATEGIDETATGEPTGTKYEFDESLFTSDTRVSQVQATAKPVLPDAPRYFRFKYLRREIDVEGNPVIGNPYAPHRMVEMLDYTCPHCRKLHPFIVKAIERYGDQLGFVIYHVPLSRKCNPMMGADQASHKNACEYAKLAYGVWKIQPEKFVEYHEWLMKGEKAPPVYEAKKKAMALVGEAVLLDKSIEAEYGKRVSDAAAELEPLKVGLPVLIFDQGVVKGMPDSEQEWFQVLESRFGVTPVETVMN